MSITQQRYARTNSAAIYLDVSESFLKKNMGKLFIEGIHFFKQAQCRLVLWEVEALDIWLKGELSPSPSNDNILISCLNAQML